MPQMPENQSVPSSIRQIARTLRLTGWIGFWVQIVLAVVSSAIFLFAIASARTPANASPSASNPGTGGSIFFAVCGLFVLYFSIYQNFRYTRIANQLQDPNPNLRPKKSDTIKMLRFGLTVSLVGMLLTVIGAEAITGTLLAKALSQPQGTAIYNPEFINRIVQPLDIFVVLANTHTISAHFAGIVTAGWLLNRIAGQ